MSNILSMPPAPVAKPPRPIQARPFELDTTMMIKSKRKTQAHTREQGIVGCDAEDTERSAELCPRFPSTGDKRVRTCSLSHVHNTSCTPSRQSSYNFRRKEAEFCTRKLLEGWGGPSRWTCSRSSGESSHFPHHTLILTP